MTFDYILNQTHVAIAGMTGCGKSTLIRQILYTGFRREAYWEYLDFKKVELDEYSQMRNCVGYIDEPEQIALEMRKLNGWLDNRFYEMKIAGLRQTAHTPVYIVVDEMADLVSLGGRSAVEALARLGRLGRAAGFHLIIATQNPSKMTGLPAQIMQNMTCTIGMKCKTAVESRQIVGVSGCELLPKHGEVMVSADAEVIKMTLPPPVTDAEMEQAKAKWLNKFKII